MSEQFGFWVACLVLIAVVAVGCQRDFDVEVVEISDGRKCLIEISYAWWDRHQLHCEKEVAK